MINNRYNVLRKLGEGGSGEVYLVNDVQTGGDVAMKVFHGDRLLDINGLEREFKLLGRFDHPNLIRVFELGEVLSSETHPAFLKRHYFTMEYLTGSDALRQFGPMPDGPGKATLLEETFIQVLLALESVHREGLIHYDIKPQNIFVLQNGGAGKPGSYGLSAKLTDFGFSTTAAIAPENNLPQVRGTIEYIAPELLRGGQFDRSIDFYSLGATFYHLWNGKCPYQGATAIETLRRVLETDAPPLHTWNGTRSRLPNIVSKLLNKNPGERYASAWEILSEFASSHHEDAIKRSLVAILSTSFVGRRREMELIANQFEKLKTEGPQDTQSVSIEGPVGCGKTRLLEQIARRGTSEACAVVERLPGAGNSTVPAEPFSALSSPARDGRPVVVLIDDVNSLQHEAQRRIARSFAAIESNRKLLVYALSDEHDVLDPSLGGAVHSRLTLDELAMEEVQELFQIAFGEGVIPHDFLEGFYRLYGGSPRIVQHAIRMLVTAIPLRLMRDRASFEAMRGELEDFLASGLADILTQESLRLRVEKRILLQLLSCLELAVSRELLTLLVPFRRTRLEEFIHSLERAGYVQAGTSKTHYSLRHKSLRNSLYASLEPEDRPGLHEFIALCWAGMKGKQSWEESGEIGRLFECAGKYKEASAHYERGGDLASGEGMHLDAAALYSKACEASAGDPTVSLRMKQARSHARAGSDAKCIELWKSLLEDGAVQDGQQIEVSKELGKAFARLGENSQAMRIFENVLATSPGAGDRFEIHQELIALKTAAGLFDDALALGNEQRTLAAEFTDRQQLALVENDIGIAYFYKGDLQKSLDSFNRAYHIYWEAENSEKIITSLNNMGNVLDAMGETRRALESWNNALKAAQDPTKQHERALLFNNIGIAHFKLGEFSEARNNYERAMQLSIELQEKSGTGCSLTNLGEVEFAEGNYERAIDSWREALRLYREMDGTFGIGQTLLALASVRLLMGETTEANGILHEASQIIRDFTLTSLEPFLHFLEGEFALATGEHERAGQLYEASEQGFRSVKDPFTGGRETPEQKIIQIEFRRAEGMLACGRVDRAIYLLTENERRASTYPSSLRAEHEFVSGIFARCGNDTRLGSPLLHFKRALGYVENEHVSELTWRISLELAEEYHRRGNGGKARECFTAAVAVLEHFASKFCDESLRRKYLDSHGRAGAMQLAQKELSNLAEGGMER